MSQEVKFGSLNLIANKITEQTFDRNTLRLTASPDGQRDAERGLVKAVYSTFHSGGLRPDIGFGVWQRDMDKIRFTQGLVTHIPFGLFLPYKLNQTRLAFTVDDQLANGYMAHQVNANRRWYCAVMKSLVVETNYASDPTPVERTTSGLPATYASFSGIATTGSDLLVTLYGTAAGTDGTIRAVWYCATPTASPAVFAGWDTAGSGGTAVTHRAYGMAFIKDYGVLIVNGYQLDQSTGVGADGFSGLFYGSNTAISGKLHDTNGANIGIVQGAYIVGTMPSDPHRIVMVIPQGQAAAAGEITTPRMLAYCDITNPSGTPAGTMSYPNTESQEIGHAVPFLGGVVYTADTVGADVSDGYAPMIMETVKMIDSNNIVRDLQLPKSNGSNPIGVMYLVPRGRHLIAHCVYLDLSNEIDLVWTPDGTWHSLGALYATFSPSSTNWRFYGLPSAEVCVSENQHYRYHVSSDSADAAGHMNFDYQYTPPNLLDNPLFTHTTQNKQLIPTTGSAMYVESIFHDRGGPVEANKSTLQVKYLSLWADTFTSYGEIQFSQYSDNRSGTGIANFSHTFTDIFEEYNVPGGKPFRSVMDVIGLFNASNSVDTSRTPNGLPILTMQVVKWPKLSEWTLDLDLQATLLKNNLKDWSALKSQFKTIENSKDSITTGNPVQRFIMGNDDVPATLEQYVATGDVPMQGQPTERDLTPTIVIREAPGASH